jgi:sugar lactone lactonase YvrE
MHLLMNMVIRIMRRPGVAISHDDSLGEGPVWDARAGRLIWVDIKRKLVQTWCPGSTIEARSLPDEVSMAVPTDDGRWLVAQVDHLSFVGDSELLELCDIDPDNSFTRLNDACCDQQGRLWVGTYSTRGDAEAAVFCVEGNGPARQVLGGLIAANGLAWTADGSGLWVTDTGRGRVDLYALDGAEARLEAVRPLMTVDGTRGRPDGIALDREGGVWVAMWGGAHLRRYDPDGALTHTVPVPVTYPTSVAFGGPDLTTLYVTTSSHHLGGPSTEALAGSILELSPEIPGLPTPVFSPG